MSACLYGNKHFLILLLQKGRRALFSRPLSRVLRVYKVPPGKVLIIGAGVAGLSAIATVCLSDPKIPGVNKLTVNRPVDLVLLFEVLTLAQLRVNKFNLLGPSFLKSLSRRKVVEQEVTPRKCLKNLSKQRWRFSWNNAKRSTSS